jgi:nucleoid-associated protein YgaU
MDLRTKYDQAIQVAKSLRMEGSAQERDGKLYFNGTVKSEDERNQIWNALKTVGDWRTDVIADIKVVAPPAAAAPKTYTVQAGDTLSKIAKAQLGNTNDYMKIFDANRDQLSDPDKIRPGQVLRMPA